MADSPVKSTGIVHTSVGPSSTYAETVYQVLRDEIVSGVLRPGDRLAETGIAARMGTSQGPIREALARLRAQGLIQVFPHRGSFVAELTLEEAKDIYSTRAILERRALELALPNLTDADYVLFESDVDEMERTARGADTIANVTADMRFHRRIFEAAGSPTLLQFWDFIEAKTRKFAAAYTSVVFSDPMKPVRSHYVLLDRMREGYGPELEAELDRHLQAIWLTGELTRNDGNAESHSALPK
jgi:DNA-binding GntR family transcriptional regulator